MESLGGVFLSVPYQEDGSGSGGYAKEMSAGYKEAEVEKWCSVRCSAVCIVWFDELCVVLYCHGILVFCCVIMCCGVVLLYCVGEML